MTSGLPSSNRQRVRVVVRNRPNTPSASQDVALDPRARTVTVRQSSDTAAGTKNENLTFSYDAVLANSSQERVFEEVGVPICDSVMQGYNGTALCYGQTGAGKSFTMVGPGHEYQQRGLLPRCLARIFSEVSNRPEYEYTLRFSCLEIYNESMYDLLATLPGTERQDLSLCEQRGSVVVKGLSAPVVSSEEEVLRLVFEAESNRAVAQHKLNEHSSRSHVLYMLQVSRASKIESSGTVLNSKLTMVDLAGSERLKKSSMSSGVLPAIGDGGRGEQLEREAKAINKSLSFLEQVVVALGSRSRAHVPHRSSKLTSVLRESLGGNCKTVLVANVWMDDSHVEETLSTLRFAGRMAAVSVAGAVVNQQTVLSPEAELQRCHTQIAELKRELAMHDQLANRSNVAYDAFSDAARKELRTQVLAYIDDESNMPEVTSLRHMREAFGQFRELYLEQAEQLSRGVYRNDGATDRPGVDGGQMRPAGTGAVDEPSHDFVGEAVAGGAGFGVGVAPNDAKPPVALYATAGGGVGGGGPQATGSSPPMLGTARDGALSENSSQSSPARRTMRSEGKPGRGTNGLEQALAEFNKGPGYEITQLLATNKAALREKKSTVRTLGLEVNAAKQSIDELKESLERKKAQRQQADGSTAIDANGEAVDVIDEEEFSMHSQLKASKAKYRAAFDKLRDARSECEYTAQVFEECERQLRTEFEQWLTSEDPEAAAAAGYGIVKDGGEQPDAEPLDEEEAHEQLAIDRLLQRDPESVAYFKAAKTASARGAHRSDQTSGVRAKHKGFQ